MKFKLDFNIEDSPVKLNHSDKTILLGSCFSTEIATKLEINGFQVCSNPFGTLFHPEAIANVIKSSIQDDTGIDSIQSDDIFHSWDSAGTVFGSSKKDLKERVLRLRKGLRSDLETAKVLVITFGTSWGYYNIELSKIVGNCHKVKQDKFSKSLSSADSMLETWKELVEVLKAFNPELEIVFTVSPVRHKKDGLIENNRSKARLIELVHELTRIESVSYFPAYEIVIDELRDYRFFNEDLVHPNNIAVDYVWETFEKLFCPKETISLSKEIKRIKLSENHKSLYPNSNADMKMKASNETKKKELLLRLPHLKF